VKYIIYLLILIYISACQKLNVQKNSTETIKHTVKPCTKIYLPICAKIPSLLKEKTFSNQCMMNNNPDAIYLHKGKCK